MKSKVDVCIYLLAIIGVFLLPISSCQKVDTNVNFQAQLQTLVDNELAAYKAKVPDYPGGIAMKVISKQGIFFVSSGMGTNITDGIHNGAHEGYLSQMVYDPVTDFTIVIFH